MNTLLSLASTYSSITYKIPGNKFAIYSNGSILPSSVQCVIWKRVPKMTCLLAYRFCKLLTTIGYKVKKGASDVPFSLTVVGSPSKSSLISFWLLGDVANFINANLGVLHNSTSLEMWLLSHVRIKVVRNPRMDIGNEELQISVLSWKWNYAISWWCSEWKVIKNHCSVLSGRRSGFCHTLLLNHTLIQWFVE